MERHIIDPVCVFSSDSMGLEFIKQKVCVFGSSLMYSFPPVDIKVIYTSKINCLNWW